MPGLASRVSRLADQAPSPVSGCPDPRNSKAGGRRETRDQSEATPQCYNEAVTDPLVIAVIVLLVVSGTAWGILQLRKDSEPTTVDRVLKLFALPLLGLGLLALILLRGKPGATTLPGDDNLTPDEPTDPDDRETEAERVRRVIETEADRVETHVRDTATDDEVAARGAGLFDPGVSPSDDD